MFPVVSTKLGVVGVLARPGDENRPVVLCRPETGAVLTLSSNAVAYVKTLVAKADFEEHPNKVQILAYFSAVEVGAAKALGKGIDRYILLKIGPYCPAAYETLAREHLAKGDFTSAFITAEKYADTFGDVASPRVFQAKLLRQVDSYALEARDAARQALSKPLWTLGHSQHSELKVNPRLSSHICLHGYFC